MTVNQQPPSQMPIVPPRKLLGPGPVDANPRVLRAMSQPMIGYMDPDFLTILDETASLLAQVYGTTEAITMALPGTGMSGMEAGLNSLLEPGDTVIMCVYGFFGERFVDIAERHGANVVALRAHWGSAFPEEMLEEELKKHSNVKLVTAIHAETSTGVRQSLVGLSRLAKEHGALFMADCVTSLGGIDVKFDEWNIDFAYSASQKCMGCPPGLAPVAISQQALDVIKNRKTKPQSWYLDLGLLANYWGGDRVYHHTAPVSNIVGLREGMHVILEEGLENRYERHKLNAAALRAGLESFGMDFVVDAQDRLDQITVVWIPDGVDDMAVRRALLREHNIEIGGGLGDFAGKAWRFGLMGESSRSDYVLGVLSAMESILPKLGYEVPLGASVSAASKVLSGV